VLGSTRIRGLVLATGHFRNGILLAPITAQAIAELVATGNASIDLAPFAIERFAMRTTWD
jgi:glycine oxidase